MKLITRDTDYAIRVIKYLAKQKYKFATARQIIENIKIPNFFLKKIIRLLSKNKIISSYKGKNGGIELMMNQELNILDIMQIFQGKFEINKCSFKKKPCPEQKNCIMRKKLLNIEGKIKKELMKIKIQNII